MNTLAHKSIIKHPPLLRQPLNGGSTKSVAILPVEPDASIVKKTALHGLQLIMHFSLYFPLTFVWFTVAFALSGNLAISYPFEPEAMYLTFDKVIDLLTPVFRLSLTITLMLCFLQLAFRVFQRKANRKGGNIMLRYRVLLVSGVILLSGCAGMNSEFEFGKPAKDSGYWMSEADAMTDTASHSTTKHKGEVIKSATGLNLSAYRLIQLNNLQPAVTVLTERPQNRKKPLRSPAKNLSSRWLTNNITLQSSAACPASPFLGETGAPSRQAERITRAWIAPYVSPDEVVQAGDVVYFVTTPSTWANVEKV